VIVADKNDDGFIQVSESDLGGSPGYTEILQENHYYAFGMNMEGPWHVPVAPEDKVNQYQYNGIERNSDLGLDWDLAFFRSYNPAIGRWVQIDPLSEIAPELTLYRNAFNNPLSYIDPLGLFETKREARRYRRAMRRETRKNGEKYSGGRVVKNEEGRYDLRSKDSDGYITRNSDGNLEYGVVAYDPNAIRERKPSRWERFQNSNFVSGIAYGILNDAWLTTQRFNRYCLEKKGR
jgi:RHS repeat-associated protein